MPWRGRFDWRWITAFALIAALVLGVGIVLRAAGLVAAASVATLVTLTPLLVQLVGWARGEKNPAVEANQTPHQRLYGRRQAIALTRRPAEAVVAQTPRMTFADVAGADEAVAEFQEIKEFLQNPSKFQSVGAHIPNGVLLSGPTGTGKTLLARALAGEAGIPFYSTSGSDLMQNDVSAGASGVKNLFEQARANGPAIIFIDEIDAVCGGHGERQQALTQLLIEFDGLDRWHPERAVIVIAATNRPDVLVPALLRPGRFDRQVIMAEPDLLGRKEILRLHARGKPIRPDVDFDAIAHRTPGFTGADLAKVMNEAALLTARANGRAISMSAVEEATDRVAAGRRKH